MGAAPCSHALYVSLHLDAECLVVTIVYADALGDSMFLMSCWFGGVVVAEIAPVQ